MSTLNQVRTLILLALLITANSTARGQALGDFRTVASGDWGISTTWETFDGASWVAAVAGPTSLDNTITVRTGHIATVADDVTADQIVVETGAQIVTTKVLTVVDGPGIDLQVEGVLQLGDHVELLGTSSAVFGSAAQLIVNSGELKVKDNSAVSFESGSSATINGGKLNLTQSGLATFAAGSVLENYATVDVQNTSTLDIDGATYINHDNTGIGGDATVIVASGGVYEHARDGGNILKAGNVTWETGSTCLVTGTTGGLPGELDQDFYNFTWDAAGQTKDLDLDRKILSVAGTFTVADTGSFLLSWEKDHDDDFLLGGNYEQTGGVFTFTNGDGIGTMDIPGDLTISGGTLLLTSNDGAPTLTVEGDFDLSGGSISETGTGSGTILLNGSSNQLVTASGSITNDLVVELDNAAGATLATALEAPSDLTITAGTLDLASNELTVAGDLLVNGALANPDRLTFDGSTNQSLTYAPGTLTVPSLKVDNSGGDLTLATNLTVTSTVTLSSGDMIANGNTVTLRAGATLLEEGGVFSGSLIFERDYLVDADGWRMISSPLAGVNYSSLNGAFHTQGGHWANVVDAQSNLRTLSFNVQYWDEVKGSDAPFVEAEGYIFYMFADDDVGADLLPATWTVTGTTQTGSDRSLSFNSSPADSWSLVGNPLTSNLDWDDMVTNSTSVGNTYATWDPSLTPGGGLTGYRYYNSSSGVGDAGRYIPPFQSFMAQAVASGASISFETSESANAQAANYYGKTSARAMSPHLRLMIEGGGVAENETYLIFDPAATSGPDSYDVQRLQPLGEPYATIMFSGDYGPGLAFDGRSMETGVEEYELCVATSENGWYTLTWPRMHDLPDSWDLLLADTETGDLVNLRNRSSYEFRVEDVDDGGREFDDRCGPDRGPRLLLRVADSSRLSVEEQWPGDVPVGVRLNQNYPNPFTTTTTIRFGLAESGSVRLEIFDVLGRRVAQVVDEVREAGWHEVGWDAHPLPSGVYVYRLVTEGGSRSSTMLLRK